MFKLYRVIKIITKQFSLSLGLPPHACRFTPSCSHYCGQAFTTYKPLKASWLCLARIVRCNPLSKPGPDPLP